MESPDTLSQVIARLRQQGYSEDLNLHHDNPLWLDPDAYHVDEVFRFEGPSNPDDESILYALSSVRYQVRGVLVNGYGLSADPVTSALEQRLYRFAGSTLWRWSALPPAIRQWPVEWHK